MLLATSSPWTRGGKQCFEFNPFLLLVIIPRWSLTSNLLSLKVNKFAFPVSNLHNFLVMQRWLNHHKIDMGGYIHNLISPFSEPWLQIAWMPRVTWTTPASCWAGSTGPGRSSGTSPTAPSWSSFGRRRTTLSGRATYLKGGMEQGEMINKMENGDKFFHILIPIPISMIFCVYFNFIDHTSILPVQA